MPRSRSKRFCDSLRIFAIIDLLIQVISKKEANYQMATIYVGGFGFGRHFKTLEAAINDRQTMDSDTIVIKKKHLMINVPAVVTKTLYIEGGGTTINVKTGQAGIIVKSGSLYLKNVNFVLGPQSNGMLFQASDSGVSDLTNVNFEHSKIKLRETYPSLRIESPSQGQPMVSLTMNNCNVDYLDGELKELDLNNCTIGRLYRTQSNVIAYTLNGQDLTVNNTYLSNGNTLNLDKLTTSGQVQFNGHYNISEFKIVPGIIDQGNNKNVSDYYKAQKLIKQAVDNHLANSTNLLINVFGDNKYNSELIINNLQIDETKPFYHRQFMQGQFSNITLKNATIPQLDSPSVLSNCSITLDNTIDQSAWQLDHTQTANKLSKSSMFGSQRKVSGVRSVNGALTDDGATPSNGGALAKLDTLIGMKSVKKMVHGLVLQAVTDKIRAEKGLSNSPLRLHTVLAGNPGTGKTVTAQLLSQALYENGVLPTNKFTRVQVGDLIGQYNGETRQKTKQVIRNALDGVLFIDEAYGLAHQNNSNDNYGDQAVEVLLQAMENYPDRLMVIMAGYTQQMRNFINNSNPGLPRRFTNWIQFPDYSPKEMLEILQLMLNQQSWQLADVKTAKELRNQFLQVISVGSNVVGNAGFCRTVVDKLKKAAGIRVAKMGLENTRNLSKRDLSTITYDDVVSGMNEIKQEQINLRGTY